MRIPFPHSLRLEQVEAQRSLPFISAFRHALCKLLSCGASSRGDDGIGAFTRYLHDDADSTSISADMVWSILEDNEGFIWAGAEQGGLNRLDPYDESFYAVRR